MSITNSTEGEKENPEELIWNLVEEEINKRTKTISETKKLEYDDIILFSIISLRNDLDNLNGRVSELDNRLSSRIDRIENSFRWMLGIIIVMWVSIILTIIFV